MTNQNQNEEWLFSENCSCQRGTKLKTHIACLRWYYAKVWRGGRVFFEGGMLLYCSLGTWQIGKKLPVGLWEERQMSAPYFLTAWDKWFTNPHDTVSPSFINGIKYCKHEEKRWENFRHEKHFKPFSLPFQAMHRNETSWSGMRWAVCKRKVILIIIHLMCL